MYRVLVVDDEQVVIDSARKILALGDFTVDTAFTAPEALEKLEHNAYNVLITDIMLPDISGLQLLKIVSEKFPHIPVISFTGYATLENAVKSFRLGGFDFLPKPFQIEELLSIALRAAHFGSVVSDANYLSFWEQARKGSNQKQQYYFLGKHSWAMVEQDGSAVLGLAETFYAIGRDTKEIQLRSIDADIDQGGVFSWLKVSEELSHKVCAPLSGRIIQYNPATQGNPKLIDEDPFGVGWLARIIPTNLEDEINMLDLR